MKLDLRISMGLMFTSMGVVLTTWGIKTNDNVALYARSLGINVNLWWGLVLLGFGVMLYIVGQRGRRMQDESSSIVQRKRARKR